MERGIIDATEWVGPYHDYLMGFYQIAQYYYAPGWHEPGTALEFFINKKKYDELPSDLQAIFQDAVRRVNHWVLCEFETKNSEYLNKMIKEENVQIKYFPRDLLQELRAYTKEIIQEITKQDAFSKKVYASYNGFRKKIGMWSGLTEKVYYEQLQ